MPATDSAHDDPGPIAADADAAIADLVGRDAVGRLWAGDHTLWRDDPTEIANRLGWLTEPAAMADRVDELEAFAAAARAEGITHVVWCGMGGSSLFPQVLRAAFGVADRGLDLRVLDTSDPVTVERTATQVPDGATLYCFASKSGGTIETRSHLDFFWDRVGRADRFAVVTDAGSPLDELAGERGFRAVFRNNPDIGGRYSALSHFGLVPAALLGVDLRELLARVAKAREASGPDVEPARNPGLRLGAALGAAARAGRDKCTLVVPPALGGFGSWLEQLIAESTGKEGTGILPVADEPLGPPEVYGADRLFVAYGDPPELAALAAAGHPVLRLGDAGPLDLGAEAFRWEVAIALAGAVLGINPFDQPNVEAAKRAASKVLDAGPPDIPTTTVADLLATVRPGDYVAIQAYLDTGSDLEPDLARARLAIRDRLHVATTFGFGPRYLHSTGQLHKGGPPTGVFVQVVGDDPGAATGGADADVAIPGRPYTFGALLRAQAAGDYAALRERDLRVGRVTTADLLAAGR